MSVSAKKAAPKRFTSSSAAKPKPKVAAAPKKPSAFSAAPEVATEKKKNKFFVIIEKYKVSILKMNKVKLSLIVLGVVAIGAVSVAAYTINLYQQSQKQIKTLQNTKEVAKLEAKKTIDAVSKLIVLPKDETPTIATVTDSKKLKNQQFFAKASNGDKVLIYTKAKKAILFNPTQNIVIEVAPINLGNTAAKPEVAGAVTQASTITKIPTPTQTQRAVVTPQAEPTTVTQQ